MQIRQYNIQILLLALLSVMASCAYNGDISLEMCYMSDIAY